MKEAYTQNEDKNNFDRKEWKIYLREENILLKEIKKLAFNAIIESQKFMRVKYNNYSFSLREIRKFCILLEYFIEYLKKKNELFEKNKDDFFEFYRKLDKENIYKNSIQLSIYLCYYIRLSQKNFREEFAYKMSQLFREDFIEVFRKEQKFIINNIKLNKDIGINKVLLEIIFTIFICINVKIPLFIKGDISSGKSLCLQSLFQTMKGDYSDNQFFRSFPKLYMNTYYCSLYTTSKSILNICQKARSLLKNNNGENKLISLLYFKQMNLAENLPNNPLQVLKSELEYVEFNKKISIVGMSNSVLEDSLVDRGIYLSLPQFDLVDLKITANIIAESYGKGLAQRNKDFFDTLAESYHEYKEILKNNYPEKAGFHDLTDFYGLIKISIKKLLEKNFSIDENTKQCIGIYSFERYFASLELDEGITSLEIIKKIFKKKYINCDERKEYNIVRAIYDNIKDNDCRYLLIISKRPIKNYLLYSLLTSQDYINNINKEFSFYKGSFFIRDNNSEKYYSNILNKIQLQIEQNKILILSDLEIYPFLYELF